MCGISSQHAEIRCRELRGVLVDEDNRRKVETSRVPDVGWTIENTAFHFFSVSDFATRRLEISL